MKTLIAYDQDPCARPGEYSIYWLLVNNDQFSLTPALSRWEREQLRPRDRRVLRQAVATRTSPSPSPRPSPQGRGSAICCCRVVSPAPDWRSRAAGSRAPDLSQLVRRSSLSRRERAGVRGKEADVPEWPLERAETELLHSNLLSKCPNSRTRRSRGEGEQPRTNIGAPCLRGFAFLLATFLFLVLNLPAAPEPSPAEPTTAATPAQTPDITERSRIAQAIPRKSLVPPKKPRKLLVFDLNVNYGGHPSIKTANQAFQLMGEQTGAYATIISHDPQIFKPQNLQQFDAVFFNNTVGNLFTDPELRQSLRDFIYNGGGMLGLHGSTTAFTQWPGAKEDWPEFGLMLGARGANHKESTEHVFIKLDDAAHPINQAFGGKGFDFRDEFFRVQEPYSRNTVRVLLSIDTEKTDMKQGQPRGDCYRADNDYALAWVRGYGKGRVFYCTIGHNPYVFWDPTMLQFYLGAIQFALGDLEAPTAPSSTLKSGPLPPANKEK